MHIRVDNELCAGTGCCVRAAPGKLRLSLGHDEIQRVAEVVPDGTATEEELWAAAKTCPWCAISLESPDGEVIYP